MLEIKLQKGQKIFFTSDTHYSHKNICRGVSEWDPIRSKGAVRDFDNLDQMNQTIVDNINAKVGQDDVLVHLGDWSFGGFENIRKFRDRITCKNIHLITGNHDPHIVNNRDNIREIFSSVTEYYTQLLLKFEAEDEKSDKINMVLCHFPICSWENMNRGVMHLFGHVHLPPHKKVMAGKAMDVGMDGHNFSPYALTEVLYTLDRQPIRGSALPSDHHEKEV